MTRKYIGNRYSPVFMGTWDITKTYESLNVVMAVDGASYTSIKSVPIGVELTDPNFWILSGNYNAQVEAYRQETQNIKNEVVDARKGEVSLKAKIDTIDSQLAENMKQIANIKNSVGMMVESVTLEDCIEIKSLGTGYVIYYYHPNIGLVNGLEQVRLFAQVGLNVIVSLYGTDEIMDIANVVNNFKNENNVIGWYLFDEVDGNQVPLATQETKLQNVRNLSGLPCALSCNSNQGVSRRISLNFDLYFNSIYLTNTQRATAIDEIDLKMLFLQPHNSIGALVGLNKCIPILQTFEDSTHSFTNEKEMENIFKCALSVNHNKPCFFIYSGVITKPNFTKTIKSDQSIKNVVEKVSNMLVGKENVILKTTIYDNYGEIVTVEDYMCNLFEFIHEGYSIGKFQKNTLYPEISLYNGFYPTPTGGRLIIDLGRNIKHLDFRITVRNVRNSDNVTVKIDKLYSKTEGINLLTQDFSQFSNIHITKKDFNGRYLSIYLTNALGSEFDEYLIFNNISIIGIS